MENHGSSQIVSLPIRYDGRLADAHRIDMADLAEALAGWNRILVVCGNFAANQRSVRHLDAADVRVTVSEGPGGCFTLQAMIEWVSTNPLISTVVGGLTVTAVTAVFKSAANKREEMKHLRALAEQAIKQAGHRDEATVARLLDTLDRMVDSLRPAARQAVRPVGRSAGSMTIAGEGAAPTVVDEADARAILADAPVDVGEDEVLTVQITELDLENGNCKVVMDGIEGRVSGRITDPALGQPNNRYALALAAHQPIRVRAKRTTRSGDLDRLFISDSLPL